MENLLSVFSYSFFWRALIVGVLVSLCAALLGVNLVLKRYSMLGDGLSHVAFGAAAVALAVGAAPLKVAVPVVVIAAFLLLRISENGKIKGDAAIAVVSSSALAIGVIVATMTTGMNTDINNYMFGSILAVSKEDVVFTVIIAVAVILMYLLFYNRLFAATFDENFAAATGVKVKLYNCLLAVLTAVTVVIGMRMMGALLISSIITFPALSSMRVCRKYRSVTVVSVIISVFSFLTGLFLSVCYDMPAGASVVVVNLIIFLVLSFSGRIRK
ncbi:MAG: metal ABC transporter permease [Clostridia bacterium]|nr:metal ABC transporter permease [Clostridia bacterium]